MKVYNLRNISSGLSGGHHIVVWSIMISRLT